MIKCGICDKEFKNIRLLSIHINNHHKDISKIEYYLKYLNNSISSKCEMCGKEKIFYGLKKGYKKYCNDCVKLSDDVKQNRKNGLIKKYGVDSIFKINKFQNKIKNTIKEKYGVDNISQNKEIKEKVKNTIKEKYGNDFYVETEEFKEKYKKTCLEKYNAEHPMQNDKYKNKYKNKIKTKYIQKLNNNIKFDKIGPLFNINEFINTYYKNKYKFKCTICDTEFEDHLYSGHIPRCPVCHPKWISKPELEVKEYIQTIYDGDIISHDRKIIYPYELDIVLPLLNLAIEFNGDYYHTEAFGRGDDYHKMKVDLCESAGYKLYYIWESEWNNERNRIKNMLKELVQ